MTHTDELLDVIDVLTIEHVVTTVLDDGSKHFERHEGLIQQLRAAIASNLGGGASRNAPSSYVPLDADAMEKYDQIEHAIGERFRELCEGIPGLYPEQTLRQWYQAFANGVRAGKISEAEYVDQVHTLLGWVRMIEEKMSPPVTLELANSECPDCGCAWAFEKLGGAETERKVALTVRYKPDGRGGLEEATAQCGACGQLWKGSQGLRELAYDLEQKNASDV